MIEIPDALKEIVPALKTLISEANEQLARGPIGRAVEYATFEQRLSASMAGVERAVHRAVLAGLDVDAAKIRINGVLHVRVGRYATTYMTRVGAVDVPRSLYRPAGERLAKAVDPIALRVGMVEGVWLPGAARQMAFLLQQGTAREAEALARQLGCLPYSRASFDHVGHAVGARYVGQHHEIEQVLIEAFELPREARGVSVSLDRVTVPMEEPRPKPPGRPKKGAPKRPIARVYRMAYCATVTLHDKNGAALHTIRYGTMPDGDAASLCERLANDVLALLAKKPALRIVLLCDGAPEMWNLLDVEFTKDPFDAKHMLVRRLIDFYHVIEKLSAAAKVIFGDATSARHVTRWKLALLNRYDARRSILEELCDSEKADVYVGTSRPVHDAITYLTNHAERMGYVSARAQGLPIASGNVEATCKSLVAIRMKRPGSRWKTATGEHVIQLRALALSDRWDQAMDVTLRPPKVTVRRAA